MVGQVVAVGQLTSRVLLICDVSHALPIQVLRNDIRVIAAGNGCTDDLQLEHLPNNTDIRVGDVLVTSGLGGRFPEGYPVGVVSEVKVDTQRAYTVIKAHPTAGLQRLRYLLLLWGVDDASGKGLPPQEVHRVANERLMQMMPQVLPSPDEMGPPPPPANTAPAAPPSGNVPPKNTPARSSSQGNSSQGSTSQGNASQGNVFQGNTPRASQSQGQPSQRNTPPAAAPAQGGRQ